MEDGIDDVSFLQDDDDTTRESHDQSGRKNIFYPGDKKFDDTVGIFFCGKTG